MFTNENAFKGFSSETFLVASGNQALLATGNLENPTLGKANLANGQLGVVSAAWDQTREYGAMLQASDTVVGAPAVRIVQGTPHSSDYKKVGILPTSHQQYVSTPVLDGRNSTVTFIAAAPASGYFSTWSFESPTLLDKTDYWITTKWRSVKGDKYFSIHGHENITFHYKTPDYTALSTTNPEDHFIKNMVHKINQESYPLAFSNARNRGNRNIIAFAINTDAGAGTLQNRAAPTDQATIVAGDVIPVQITGGVTEYYTATAEFVNTLDELVQANVIPDTATIELIDLSTAGAVAQATAVNTADMFIVMAFEDQSAILNDDYPTVFSRLIMGGNINDAMTVTERLQPFTGQGSGRSFKLQWGRHAGLQPWSQQRKPLYDDFIQTPDYIDETARYRSYTILFSNLFQEYGVAKHDLHKVVILVPNADSTTITSLNTVLGVWINSCNVAQKQQFSSGVWF